MEKGKETKERINLGMVVYFFFSVEVGHVEDHVDLGPGGCANLNIFHLTRSGVALYFRSEILI